MDSGTISRSSFSGDIDLYHTLESGQTYTWRRSDGKMYQDDPVIENVWYETVIDGVYIAVRERDDSLLWKSTNGSNAPELIHHHLRLDDDLQQIYNSFPEDPLIRAAIERFRGMRLVRDPVFPCLISFICSSQMRVPRIYQMQQALAESYGSTIKVDGNTTCAFPTPDQLARATEEDLRRLGLGYRAPYVAETASMVSDGIDPTEATSYSYEAAREYLTQYPGIGNKVADCVLLFSLDFIEAVPLDTWIQQAIAEYYPQCQNSSYAETSRAIREEFGGALAGYVQTYVFHHLRTRQDT